MQVTDFPRQGSWSGFCNVWRLLAIRYRARDNAAFAFAAPGCAMNPRPSDPLLLAALQRAEPGRAAGEVVHAAPLQGDWLIAVAHPDRARLVLLPGGGSLWGDIPVGQKRYVSLAEQAWFFVAYEDAELGPWQVCQLAEAADGVSGLGVARTVCLDALQLLGIAPPAPVPPPAEPPQPVSRRGFLRALTGRR